MNSLSAPSATTHTMQDRAPVPWWLSMLLCGMAGGMGWGIRGQYGHESGAMMAGLPFYCGVIRRDRLALRLGIAGLIGGALGFPGGQCFQANHAWNAEWYRSGFFATLDPHMNWWNMMEISFGTIMGATLGLIVWMNRHLIHVRSLSPPVQSFLVDGTLLLIHLPLLSLSEFAGIPWIDALYGIGFCMGVIPLAASVTSRWWPFFVTMPVLVVPIAGKTVRELVYKTATIAAVPGWLLYFILPMIVVVLVCIKLKRLSDAGADGRRLGTWLLMSGAWCFFLLNFAFFHFPWPWQPWTSRTPSGLIYLICIATLTAAAI